MMRKDEKKMEKVILKIKGIWPLRKDKLVKIVIPRISCYDMQKRLCASSNVLLCNDIYMLMELCGINSISSSEHVDLLQAKKKYDFKTLEFCERFYSLFCFHSSSYVMCFTCRKKGTYEPGGKYCSKKYRIYLQGFLFYTAITS